MFSLRCYTAEVWWQASNQQQSTPLLPQHSSVQGDCNCSSTALCAACFAGIFTVSWCSEEGQCSQPAKPQMCLKWRVAFP